jgi:hypothetical protein
MLRGGFKSLQSSSSTSNIDVVVAPSTYACSLFLPNPSNEILYDKWVTFRAVSFSLVFVCEIVWRKISDVFLSCHWSDVFWMLSYARTVLANVMKFFSTWYRTNKKFMRYDVSITRFLISSFEPAIACRTEFRLEIPTSCNWVYSNLLLKSFQYVTRWMRCFTAARLASLTLATEQAVHIHDSFSLARASADPIFLIGQANDRPFTKPISQLYVFDHHTSLTQKACHVF